MAKVLVTNNYAGYAGRKVFVVHAAAVIMSLVRGVMKRSATNNAIIAKAVSGASVIWVCLFFQATINR